MRRWRSWIGILIPILVIGGSALAGAIVPDAADPSNKTFDIEDIHVDAALRRDGVLLVRERVTYDFHGNFTVGTRDFESGPWTITDIQASEDGHPRAAVTDTPTLFEWSLGNGVTSGRHTYEVRYKVHHAVLAWPDVVELNWQWVGDSAPAVNHHEVDLRVPGNGEGVRAWAHGPLNGELTIDGRDVRTTVDDLPANTFLETRVTVPRAAFSPDLPPAREGDDQPGVGFDQTCAQLRAQLEDQGVTPQDVNRALVNSGFCAALAPVETQAQLPRIIGEEQALADAANAERARVQHEEAAQAHRRRAWNLLFPFLVAVAVLGCWLVWRRWGKEPPLAQDVDYWREVPDDPPAVAQAIMHWGSVDTDVFSVTLVDLAQRGYLTIEEIPGDKKDFRFTRTDEADDDLIDFERKALTRVFPGGAATRTQKDLIAEAKGSRASSSSWLNSYLDGVKDSYSARGYEVTGSALGWVLYLLVVALLGVFAFFAIRDEAFIAGFTAIGVGVVLLPFMVLLRRRTPKGAQRHAEWDGLRRYLKDFSQLQDAPVGHLVLYERFLVAAVALGVSDELIEALQVRFPEVANDPTFATWYVGPRTAMFASLGDFNSGFSHAAASSFSPPPSSSSSSGGGFGGGFSGGGGGGGGGGGFGAR